MSIAARASSHGAIDAPAFGRQPLADRLLVATGLLGPLVFLVIVLIDGVTRPGYNALRHPVTCGDLLVEDFFAGVARSCL